MSQELEARIVIPISTALLRRAKRVAALQGRSRAAMFRIVIERYIIAYEAKHDLPPIDETDEV